MNKKPSWKVQPKGIRDVVIDGKPAFAFMGIPPGTMIHSMKVSYEPAEPFVLSTDLAARKQTIVSERKRKLHESYMQALAEWEACGKLNDPPSESLLFDQPLVRILPADVVMIGDAPSVLFKYSQTTYFDYVATRDLPLDQYPYEKIACPTSMCGVLLAMDRQALEWMVYTARTLRTEAYPRYLHVVGGQLPMPKDDSPVSATRAWIEEVHQEAGIEPEEVRSPTISGYVMDLHWPHPDITHVAYIGPILEDVFNREGCRLKPRRPTDKEVEMRCIPWTADHARALLVGDVIEGGDDDLRPWVPPGIASVLLAGYRDFGKDWFASVLAEYTERIRAL